MRHSSGAVVTDFEHATGLELKELEGSIKGVDVFDHHDFLKAVRNTTKSKLFNSICRVVDSLLALLRCVRLMPDSSREHFFSKLFFFRAQPFGTKESPCVVTSTLPYRIVGATDPDDDSIIYWGRLEEGAPAMKIGEEWFVHKRIHEDAHH